MTRNLLVIMVIVLTGFCQALPQTQLRKLNLSESTVTSSKINFGPIDKTFDGNPETLVRSDNVNPAFVQFVFESAVAVDSVNVLVGQVGYTSGDDDVWWLEAADSETDLAGKSGSYVMAVAEHDPSGGVWDSKRLPVTIKKKIWKFNIKRIVGDDYVHIDELELYSSEVKPLMVKYPLAEEIAGNNIVTVISGAKPGYEIFDGEVNSGYNFEGQSYATVLLSFTEKASFNKIRVNLAQDCSWWVEFADTYDELTASEHSADSTPHRQATAGSWDAAVLDQPITKKYWKFYFRNIAKVYTINEIELYTNKPIDSLIGLQRDLELWEGWRWRNAPNLTYLASNPILKNMAAWSSSDTKVATVDDEGNIKAIKAGQAVITAIYMNATCTTTVTVKAPVLPMVKETVEPFMAKPAQNYVYELPVLIVQYIPTADGITKDPAYAPEFYNLDKITIDSSKKKTMTALRRYKFALETGSRYHGYKDPSARPSLGIRVVDVITVYEPLPPGLRHYGYNDAVLQYAPDFEQIFDRINLKDYVENKGVKQVWMQLGSTIAYMYNYNPDVHRPEIFRASFEAFMATPTPYQACNGNNPEPLPIYNKTYTVIDNFMTFPEFTCYDFEPFTHQFEHLWQEQNILQDGTYNFFWEKFVGDTLGRCGWTHMPPNTKINYGYFHFIQADTNQVKPVMSDIEDWRPDGTGEKKLISYHAWEDIVYDWPDGISSFIGREEFQWFMYWLQNIPGFQNNIPYVKDGHTYRMSNWWKFVYDWDTYTEKEIGLWEEPTSVENTESVNPAIALYPEPNEGEINIEVNMPGWEIYSLTITNLVGSEVYRAEALSGRQAINMKEQAPGIYFARVSRGGKVVCRKFVNK